MGLHAGGSLVGHPRLVTTIFVRAGSLQLKNSGTSARFAYMAETKARTDVNTQEVQGKADSAARWCKHASDHAAEVQAQDRRPGGRRPLLALPQESRGRLGKAVSRQTRRGFDWKGSDVPDGQSAPVSRPVADHRPDLSAQAKASRRDAARLAVLAAALMCVTRAPQ